MTEYEAIFRRKSVREYSDRELLEAKRRGILDAISQLTPLYENCGAKLTFLTRDRFNEEANGQSIKSPYCIVIGSNSADGYLENAGFMGEQLVLSLTAMGLGTCWLGGIRPKLGKEFGEKYCITVAVGYPEKDNAFRTDISQFKRKPLKDYCLGNVPIGKMKTIIEAARLAPSGVNLQPIRYKIENNIINVYRKIPLIKMKIDSMQCIDSGIALAHIYEAASECGLNVQFEKQRVNNEKGLIYVVSAVIND